MFNNAMLSGFELYSRWVPLIMYSFIGLLWLLRIRHGLNYEVPQRIFFALT